MKILGVTAITERNQSTIPKAVREKMKLTSEDRLLWVEEDGKIVVKKA